MQTPKFSLWICALALCGGMTLRADDTPAQAAARAALLQQLQGNSAPAPQTSVPATTTPSSPATTPAPAMAPFVTPAATAPVDPVTGDTPAQAAARATLMQQLNPGGSTPAPAASTMTKTEVTPAPAMAPATTPAAKVSVVPVAGDTPAQAEARAALAQKMADLGMPMNQPAAPAVPAPAPAPVAAKPPMSQLAVVAAPAPAKNSTTTLQRIPMVAPPLPISTTKEEKLRILLAHYEADQITPEQYHEQRAAILAAP